MGRVIEVIGASILLVSGVVFLKQLTDAYPVFFWVAIGAAVLYRGRSMRPHAR